MSRTTWANNSFNYVDSDKERLVKHRKGDLIKEKSEDLTKKYHELEKLCKLKTDLYDEAEIIRDFQAGCKALEFWLTETRTKLEQFDGKDLKVATNQLKSVNETRTEYSVKSEMKEELKLKDLCSNYNFYFHDSLK